MNSVCSCKRCDRRHHGGNRGVVINKTVMPGLANARLTPSYFGDHTSTPRRDGDTTTNSRLVSLVVCMDRRLWPAPPALWSQGTTEDVFQWEPKARHLAGDILVKIRVG